MCSTDSLLNLALIPVALEVYMCYKCYAEPVWLEKFWVVVLIFHMLLSIMAVVLWCFAEYRIVWDTKAQQQARHFHLNQRAPVQTAEEDYAAILQAATRRKLSQRSTDTRGISKPLPTKPTKSARSTHAL